MNLIRIKKIFFCSIIVSTILVGGLIYLPLKVQADMITPYEITASDIVAIPDNMPEGSGLGTLNLVLFAFNSRANEQHGSCSQTNSCFNGDNSNSDIPTGTGPDPDTKHYEESYVTTVGKLRAFYDYQFGDGSYYRDAGYDRG